MADAHADRRSARRILGRLVRAYGRRRWRREGSAVEVLVETILSQNTADANSSAAYRRLRRRFADWPAVSDAPTSAIERCIRVSGLSRIKAPRIRRILRRIRAERDAIDLQFLGRWEPEAARAYLLGFEGVGPKTADCVLLFAFGMPLFPVDTHVRRIAIRLGWAGAESTAEQVHDLLEPRIDPADRYAMHLLLLEHGRRTCTARAPRCGQCVLRQLCEQGRAVAPDPLNRRRRAARSAPP